MNVNHLRNSAALVRGVASLGDVDRPPHLVRVESAVKGERIAGRQCERS